MTRKEAIELLDRFQFCCNFDECTNGLECEECAEAVDMAIEALQADRPRGAWLKVIDHDGYLTDCYVCDKCGMLTTDCSDFCPNCGAKMDEK